MCRAASLPSHAASHTRHTAAAQGADTSTGAGGRWHADARRAARLLVLEVPAHVRERGGTELPGELLATLLEVLLAAGKSKPWREAWVFSLGPSPRRCGWCAG